MYDLSKFVLAASIFCGSSDALGDSNMSARRKKKRKKGSVASACACCVPEFPSCNSGRIVLLDHATRYSFHARFWPVVLHWLVSVRNLSGDERQITALIERCSLTEIRWT